jgi:hypothetical protein
VYARNEGVFHLLDCQSFCTALFSSFLPLTLFIYFYFIVSFILYFPSFLSTILSDIFSPSVIFPILLPSFVLHLAQLSLHQFCLLFVILLVAVMTSHNGKDCSHLEFPTFIYSVNVSR